MPLPVIQPVHPKLVEIRERKDLKLRPTKHLKDTFTDFDGKEKPLNIRYYQVQGILHMVASPRFVLGDDCGLGKSLEIIAFLCYVWEKNPDQKVIVITTKSASNQWQKEFGKFTTGVNAILCQGSPKQREKSREAFLAATGPTVLVMGYRTAVQDFTALQNWTGSILVGDEITACKNPKTQVHQVVKHLSSQATRVYGLTATLIKNHLMEGFGIYSVIVPGLFNMSYNSFMLYFAITRMQKIPRSNRQIPMVVGYYPEKIKEFRKIIDPFFLGRAKHLVASELPSLTSQHLEVEMSPEQDAKYAEALEGLLTIMENTADATEKEVTKLTALIYCQEIVNDLGLIGCEGGSPKLEALIDILTEGDLAEDKVIVFSRFEKMVNIIMNRLAKEGIKAVRITGSEDNKAREIAKTEFQNPESDVRVICITTAGSDAINLQAAKVLVCYDTPWSAGDFLQLLGRMIRIGSVHDKVYCIHLLSKGRRKKDTIDSRVMEVLAKKMQLVEAVLGKKIKGEGDTNEVISSENEISDLFSSLKQDAREAKA